ncbi:hypothetical protein SDC9_142564 [bioreactor metagenome]|uniref:Uncharacterized protein n=1 Tax=bioreactor metagenome TaxID=1076179 RepID=A0A645E0X4_9ZZZZ
MLGHVELFCRGDTVSAAEHSVSVRIGERLPDHPRTKFSFGAFKYAHRTVDKHRAGGKNLFGIPFCCLRSDIHHACVLRQCADEGFAPVASLVEVSKIDRKQETVPITRQQRRRRVDQRIKIGTLQKS